MKKKKKEFCWQRKFCRVKSSRTRYRHGLQLRLSALLHDWSRDPERIVREAASRTCAPFELPVRVQQKEQNAGRDRGVSPPSRKSTSTKRGAVSRAPIVPKNGSTTKSA